MMPRWTAQGDSAARPMDPTFGLVECDSDPNRPPKPISTSLGLVTLAWLVLAAGLAAVSFNRRFFQNTI